MDEDRDDAAAETGSRRGALVALLVVAALVIGGIFLSQTLSSANKVQDCVMAGRNNCAPINTAK